MDTLTFTQLVSAGIESNNIQTMERLQSYKCVFKITYYDMIYKLDEGGKWVSMQESTQMRCSHVNCRVVSDPTGDHAYIIQGW